MAGFDSLVLQEQRHLKWRALDPLENLLMILCGVCITAFSVLVLGDVITRAIGRPWLWVQEATMTFFMYGIFIGVAAATRRNDHLYLAVLAESLSGNKRLFFEFFNRLVVLAVDVLGRTRPAGRDGALGHAEPSVDPDPVLQDPEPDRSAREGLALPR